MRPLSNKKHQEAPAGIDCHGHVHRVQDPNCVERGVVIKVDHLQIDSSFAARHAERLSNSYGQCESRGLAGVVACSINDGTVLLQKMYHNQPTTLPLALSSSDHGLLPGEHLNAHPHARTCMHASTEAPNANLEARRGAPFAHTSSKTSIWHNAHDAVCGRIATIWLHTVSTTETELRGQLHHRPILMGPTP